LPRTRGVRPILFYRFEALTAPAPFFSVVQLPAFPFSRIQPLVGDFCCLTPRSPIGLDQIPSFTRQLVAAISGAAITLRGIRCAPRYFSPFIFAALDRPPDTSFPPWRRLPLSGRRAPVRDLGVEVCHDNSFPFPDFFVPHLVVVSHGWVGDLFIQHPFCSRSYQHPH